MKMEGFPSTKAPSGPIFSKEDTKITKFKIRDSEPFVSFVRSSW